MVFIFIIICAERKNKYVVINTSVVLPFSLIYIMIDKVLKLTLFHVNPILQKKKRSVKSSEKSEKSKAATAALVDPADSSTPQQNGDAPLNKDPTSNAESTPTADDEIATNNNSRKVSVDAVGTEAEGESMVMHIL
jgi:hypothetical protein